MQGDAPITADRWPLVASIVAWREDVLGVLSRPRYEGLRHRLVQMILSDVEEPDEGPPKVLAARRRVQTGAIVPS